MHAIEALYQQHLARHQLPSHDLLERHTGIANEQVAHDIASRLTCALPSAEALDYLGRRRPATKRY